MHFPEETNQVYRYVIVVRSSPYLQAVSLAELALARVLDFDVGADVLYISSVVLHVRPQHLHHHL